LLKAVIFDLSQISDISSLHCESPVPFLNHLIADLHKNNIQTVNLASAFPNSNDRALAYSKLLMQLKVPSGECVTITDTDFGLLAAMNVGTTCIGYYNPQISRQDLYKAAVLVEGFDEIDFSFINKIYQYDHMEAVTILTTSNFIIRELSVEDIAELSIIYREASVRAFLDDFEDSLKIEKEKQEAYIKNVYHFYGFGLWGVFLKDNNHLVGRCGIEYKQFEGEDIYELGYLLAKPYQGLGYATEFVKAVINYCFLELAIPHIVAVIDINNTASIHLAERVGMLKCGTYKRNSRECYKYVIANNICV
jgi:RimJ/RimL family protein N-acetyltransferase